MIKWYNIDRLETRDGHRVLGCHRAVHTERTIECMVVSIEVRTGIKTVICDVVSGKVVGDECKYDIMEIPPQPRERIGWVNKFCFTDPSRTCAVACESEQNRTVRVRIIEEPEDKPCD